MSDPNPEQSLYQIASQQAGYFTIAQAREAGFTRRQASYYAQTGRWTRIRRGIYRLPFYPASPHEDLFVAWLRTGESAAISHESALALYGLSDVLPQQIHLIVSRTTSRRHEGLQLHTPELAPDEVVHFEGLPVTTVARTIADVAANGLAEELVTQAIDQALERGLMSRQALLRMARCRGGRMLELVQRALKE